MTEPLAEPIPAALHGERIDRAVALLTGASRATVRAMVEGGHVQLDGDAATKPSSKVKVGQLLVVDAEAVAVPAFRARSDIALHIVYEDDDVVVIDKAAGLVVHPGAGHTDDTMVSALLDRYPEIRAVGDPKRPGIVHRLDKGTSGLMVVARSAHAYATFVARLAAREVTRTYLALACGAFEQTVGVIDAPIGRSVRAPTRMAVTPRGRTARTHYRVEQRFTEPFVAALLECQLESGRTHQIRVHLAAIGAPVLGDDRYGGRRSQIALARPWLHASALAFAHPVDGRPLEFRSALPPDLEDVLAQFC